MAKVVIDANVIISAAYGGKPLEAVSRALRDHDVFISGSVIQELESVFRKLSKKLSQEQILSVEEKVRQLVGRAHRIQVLARVALSRDKKDDHYLSLCKEAQADFLVTGDKDLLNISPDTLAKNEIGCRIISPNSFLEIDPKA